MSTPKFPDFDESTIISFQTAGGGKAGLAKMIASRSKSTEQEKVNFEPRKQVWIRKVAELYDLVEEEWLGDLIKNGQVQTSRKQIRLHEEHIGEYDAPELTILIAEATVRLEPRGTLIVGASGRVDMTGPNGTLLLLLESPPEDSALAFDKRHFTWSIVSRAPQVVRATLDEDSFSDALSNLL